MAKRKVSKKKVKLAKMFMTTRGTLFSEKDLKRYEMPQTKQLSQDDNISWGKQVIDPPYDLLRLMNWLDLSVAHASCVKTKVQDTVGIGYKFTWPEESEPDEAVFKKVEDFFSKVNDLEDITMVCKKIMLDYEGCGNGYFEVARGLVDIDVKPEDEKAEEGNEEDESTPLPLKALFHATATNIRLTKDKEMWVQMVSNKKVYFKIFGDERILNKNTGNFVDELTNPEDAANELIQLNQYTYKSDVYGLPEWLPAVFQMFGEQKEKEYNLDFFTNFGVPAYAVILEGTDMSKEDKDAIQKYFETELKDNPHRTMVFGLPDGGTIKFEALNTETKEASFRIYRRDNRDDILTAHHVPPYRAGIVEKGQLGGGVAREVDEIYLDSVINPRQNEFEWVINELLIKGIMGIDNMFFEFEDIDIKDQKTQAEIDKQYFAMGARTPNEILVAQGKDPYDGGDIYYLPANLIPVGQSEKRLSKEKDKDDDGNADASDYSTKGKGGGTGGEAENTD